MAKEILHEIHLNEISAVDRPAQEGARATIMKRAPGVPDNLSKKVVLTTVVDGHQHVIDDLGWDKAQLDGGTTSWTSAKGDKETHSHPWVRNPDGTITVGMAEGHTHEILESQLFKATEQPPKETDTMKTAEELQKALDTANAEAATNAARLAKAEKIAEFSDAERAFYKGLDEAGKTAFLAKSADDRANAVKADAINKADQNPVIYTAGNGDTFRKNDDPRLIKMAKDRDEDRAELQKARDRATDLDLTKRAEGLGNLGGTTDAKKALLKSLDGIADESVRKAATEILTSANSGLEGAFKKRGGGGGINDTDTPSAKLEKLAKAQKTANPALSDAQAMDAVLKTAEGVALYEQASVRPN